MSLEWITHAEVQGGILPLEVVYPTLSHRLVRAMQLHTPVKTQDDECDVYSQAHTRIETELLVECVPMKYAVGRYFVAVAVQIPHIT